MELAVDASNNRLYVSDTWNSMIQIFSEESDGIDWIKKLDLHLENQECKVLMKQ